VFCKPFLCLNFGFEIFWYKNIGAKAAHKMLMKLTTGVMFMLSFYGRRSQKGKMTYDSTITKAARKMLMKLTIGNQARFQKLMLHGFKQDECTLKEVDVENATFTPGTCGYLCPTKSVIKVKPRFVEYKVTGPNRGSSFGNPEVGEIVNLETPDARMYHEPVVYDNSVFFPMNWTFHLSCDRIRTNDCIFNPITRAPTKSEYKFHLRRVSSPYRAPNVGPSFDVISIAPPETGLPITTPVNCGAKEVVAQIITTVDKNSLTETESSTSQVLYFHF